MSEKTPDIEPQNIEDVHNTYDKSRSVVIEAQPPTTVIDENQKESSGNLGESHREDTPERIPEDNSSTTPALNTTQFSVFAVIAIALLLGIIIFSYFELRENILYFIESFI